MFLTLFPKSVAVCPKITKQSWKILLLFYFCPTAGWYRNAGLYLNVDMMKLFLNMSESYP